MGFNQRLSENSVECIRCKVRQSELFFIFTLGASSGGIGTVLHAVRIRQDGGRRREACLNTQQLVKELREPRCN